MNIRYIILGICVVLCSQQTFAQDLEAFKSAFAKSATYYNTLDQYTLAMSYAFYEDETQETPNEKLEGRVIKEGTNYYSKIDQTEFVYVGKEFVKINHGEKAVLYGKMEEQQPKAPVEIEQLLVMCKDAKILSDVQALIFEIELHQQFGLPYSKMRFTLDRDSYAIVQQEIYLPAGQPYPWQVLRTKTSDTPSKMVITLTEEVSDKEEKTPFRLADYIRRGSSVTLAHKLTAYTLYDATK